MKLVLANNQTPQFTDFHKDLQGSDNIYEYAGYKSLLFHFSTADNTAALTFTNVDTRKTALDFDGVYINGYLNTPELAVSVATVLDANKIIYVNRELGNALSLSKLTAYAKLAAAGVNIPETYGGSAYALKKAARAGDIKVAFPIILKRADADRGIDNFKITSAEEVAQTLEGYDELSIWIAQEFVPNEGYYLVSFYGERPVFSIFRGLEARPDGNEKLAHMFKPKGGANAQLIEIGELPESVLKESQAAIRALDRQIASVDSLYDPATQRTYVLEVNYNPQLVTITTFADIRKKAFLDGIKEIGGKR